MKFVKRESSEQSSQIALGRGGVMPSSESSQR